MNQPLHAPLEISFDYTRSLGPTLGEFVTALAGRRILGARASDGRVHAPPFEFDPLTGTAPAEFVEVGPGRVLSGLMRDINRDVKMLNVRDPDSLVKFRGARAVPVP